MIQPTEDVAVLRTYLASLNKAIGTGARSVTLGGQTIIYNTTESLIKARNYIKAQIDAAEAATSNQRVSRQTYAVFGGRDYE